MITFLSFNLFYDLSAPPPRERDWFLAGTLLGKETLAAISLELITAGRLTLDVCAKDKAAGQTGHRYM